MPKILNRDAKNKELRGWGSIWGFCTQEFSRELLPHSGRRNKATGRWNGSHTDLEEQYGEAGLPITLQDGEPVTSVSAMYDWYENLPTMSVTDVQRALTLLTGVEPLPVRVKGWIEAGIGEHEGEIAKHNVRAWVKRSDAWKAWAKS